MVTVIKMLQLLKIVLSKISGWGIIGRGKRAINVAGKLFSSNYYLNFNILRYLDQYITNMSRYVDELNTTTVVILAKATKHIIDTIKIVLSLKYNLRNSNNTIILSKNKKYLII